jgi:flagellar hook-associated protein FlgK
MTDLVSVASNAVASYQRALGTVSNNIANVATDGYSRQEVVLQANPTAKIGNVYLGTGVMIDRVKRQYDTFAELNLRNSNSDLASQEPMVTYANRVIDIMGSDSMGLNSALDKFFNTARDLSTDPASSVKRSSFIRDAQGLTDRFGQLSGQLDLVQNETDQAINGYVSEVNTLAKQIAQVNQQMTKHPTAEAQPPDLLDQRDLLLKNLSSFAHLNTHFNANGSVDISLGPSFAREVIVQGAQSTMVGVTIDETSPEKVNLILDPYGKAQPLTAITSGKISGMLSFREQILGTSRNALNDLASTFAKEANKTHESGVDAYGNPGSALFKMGTASAHAAANIQIVFEDPMRVAAASQFRIIESPQNTSGVDANIVFEEPDLAGPAQLQTILGANAHPDAGVPVKISNTSSIAQVATIPNGLKDIGLFLSGADTNQQLQVFTRDGRQVGGVEITAGMQNALLTPENGFVPGATYSSAYLNQTNSNTYKNMQVFYGAKAEVGRELQWDMQDADPQSHIGMPGTAVPATLTGYRIPQGQTWMAGGLLQLNGQSLDVDVTPANGASTLQATDFANWINQAGIDDITATAENSISISASQIKLDQPLWIKDPSGTPVEITFSAAPANVDELVQYINLQSSQTNVEAHLTDSGGIVLTNTLGHQGEDIVIDDTFGTSNALGIAPGIYTGRLSLTRPLVDGVDTPIEMTFANGKPADLANLGISTGVYIKTSGGGDIGEDLLVFVTGAGESKVSATYAGTPVSAKQSLRTQSFAIQFDEADPVTGNAMHYTITDKLTGTVVASRPFNPAQLEPGINYLGLQMSFSSPPKVGDIYELDGNKDGTGNNENMLVIAALENKRISNNGKSIGASYIDHVNDMGNIARQAAIAKTALTVVHDQAVATRDQVSGVSLDNEAADLIRYQQAYQAAAKILQISSQLFDSVLQVR